MSLPFGFRSSPLRVPRALACNIASGRFDAYRSATFAPMPTPALTEHNRFRGISSPLAAPVFHGRLCSAHAGVSHGYRDRTTADEQTPPGGGVCRKEDIKGWPASRALLFISRSQTLSSKQTLKAQNNKGGNFIIIDIIPYDKFIFLI